MLINLYPRDSRVALISALISNRALLHITVMLKTSMYSLIHKIRLEKIDNKVHNFAYASST